MTSVTAKASRACFEQTMESGAGQGCRDWVAANGVLQASCGLASRSGKPGSKLGLSLKGAEQHVQHRAGFPCSGAAAEQNHAVAIDGMDSR